ncbi:DNA-binding response regulator [Sphingobacteriaceae bacterium]|nr:DNA-binding response regulator [Sphingobacteriaceae bacterium]
MNIRAIIIEDEPLAVERTKMYLEKIPFVSLVACFTKAKDALEFLGTNSIDLIFLDINLGEISGIQLLETKRPEAEVIITTAYEEHALKGYELNVIDYLLKPYSFERFLQAVEKVLAKLSKKENEVSERFIFIKTENRVEKVFLKEILYIEGMRDYRRIHTLSKRIMTLQNFKELEIEIPSAIICRVHKSYMVALDKIVAFEKDKLKVGEVVIPISETYKKGFFDLLPYPLKKD